LGIRSAIYQEIHKLLEIAFEDLSALISRRALLDKSLRLWNRLSQRAAKRLKFLFRRYKSKALDSRPILLGKYGDVLCDLALVLAESVSGLADPFGKSRALQCSFRHIILLATAEQRYD
jgi:hypothetical protein